MWTKRCRGTPACSPASVMSRLANLSPCLIGIEACVGAHHLSRKLQVLGRQARLMRAKYVRPYSKGRKNDFRDAEAIAEAVRCDQDHSRRFIASVGAWSASAPVRSALPAGAGCHGTTRSAFPTHRAAGTVSRFSVSGSDRGLVHTL